MRRLLKLVEKVLLGFATLALLLMMISVSADALGRHLFNSPFRGSFELTSDYFMVILVFAALSANFGEGRHVRLDILSIHLSRLIAHNYKRMIALICLPVFAALTFHACAELIAKAQSQTARGGAVIFPALVSYAWVALGGFTISVRLALDIINPHGDEVPTSDRNSMDK